MKAFSVPVMAGLVLSGVGCAPAVSAQQISLAKQIIGSWSLVTWQQTRSDGSTFERFGAHPKGLQVFDDTGRYIVMIARADLPKFSNKNPNLASADEARAVVGGAVASFGTYSVNESQHLIVLNTEVSTFPNQVGSVQKRIVTSITATRMIQHNPEATSGGAIELVWTR